MAQKDQATLQSDIVIALPDNTSGFVSVEDVRTTVQDITESCDIRETNEGGRVALLGDGTVNGDLFLKEAGGQVSLYRRELGADVPIVSLTDSVTTDRLIVKTAGSTHSNPTDSLLYITEASTAAGRQFERNLIRPAFADGAIVIGGEEDDIFFTPPTSDGLLVSTFDGAPINLSTLMTVTNPTPVMDTADGTNFWKHDLPDVTLGSTHQVKTLTFTSSGTTRLRYLQTRAGKIEAESDTLSNFLLDRTGVEVDVVAGVNNIEFWFSDFFVGGQTSAVQLQTSDNVTLTSVDMSVRPKRLENIATLQGAPIGACSSTSNAGNISDVVNTWNDLNQTTACVAGININKWSLFDSLTGELEYTGLLNVGSEFIATLTFIPAFNRNFEFRVLKNGAPLVPAQIFGAAGKAGDNASMTILVPVVIATGDKFRIQVQCTDGGLNCDVSQLSIVIA